MEKPSSTKRKARTQKGAKVVHSPLVEALNVAVPARFRWCTPSILPTQQRIHDAYASDVSVSYHDLGVLQAHSGLFGEAERFAARTHGADRTLLSPNGSSGGIAVVLRMLAIRQPGGLVLVSANAHASVIHYLKMFGLDFRFLPGVAYDPRFETLLPPRVEDVLAGLAQFPQAMAVLYTSPNYEGLSAQTAAIVQAVRSASEETLVIVDEAWGAHFAFQAELPGSAMASGADACTQSTHKMAGSLQQSALIHWREERIDSHDMDQAYHEYTTTSPSYLLLGSLDAATRALAHNGPALLEECINRAKQFRRALRSRVPELEVLELGWVDAAHAAGHDPLKTVIGLSRFAMTGIELAQLLSKRNIIVEHAGLNSVIMITTFQLPIEAIEATAQAIAELLAPALLPAEQRKNLFDNPLSTSIYNPKLPPGEASRRARFLGEDVPLNQAAGRIAGEQVQVFPPGIPLTLEGCVITEATVAYLQSAIQAGAAVMARDPSLATVRVLGAQSTPVTSAFDTVLVANTAGGVLEPETAS